MALDVGGGGGGRSGRFDDVRVQRSLGEEAELSHAPGFLAEHIDELSSDRLPLGFGIGDALERPEEPLLCIHDMKVDAKTGQRLLDIVPFALAEQSVIYEYGLVVDAGPHEEKRQRTGIDPPRHGEQNAVPRRRFPHLIDGAVERVLR